MSRIRELLEAPDLDRASRRVVMKGHVVERYYTEVGLQPADVERATKRLLGEERSLKANSIRVNVRKPYWIASVAMAVRHAKGLEAVRAESETWENIADEIIDWEQTDKLIRPEIPGMSHVLSHIATLTFHLPGRTFTWCDQDFGQFLDAVGEHLETAAACSITMKLKRDQRTSRNQDDKASAIRHLTFAIVALQCERYSGTPERRAMALEEAFEHARDCRVHDLDTRYPLLGLIARVVRAQIIQRAQDPLVKENLGRGLGNNLEYAGMVDVIELQTEALSQLVTLARKRGWYPDFTMLSLYLSKSLAQAQHQLTSTPSEEETSLEELDGEDDSFV